MKIIYQDADILVCLKPPRVLSTDEPGGLPELIRQELGDEKADVRTVHRLDRVVSGLMVLARNAAAASALSKQIRENTFQKEYLAVVHGSPEAEAGTLTDLLLRDKARKMTMVVTQMQKGAQNAVLRYRVAAKAEGMTKVNIQLITGRTHQIRVQFASRGMPLVGERKYAVLNDDCEIALWSAMVGFTHPTTGEKMVFREQPPRAYPWSSFENA
ncbi:MAG: RluA family pseudouridine synthase [Oscillospiraceae bacterium]|nr:RluA family pseudouridine synthase [Oscillospiraceae bacterium]